MIGYIDGFNLYHGLRDARLKNSRWLDIHGMCVSLLKPGEQLERVRYFTSWVKDNPVKTARQAVYIDALRARGGIEIDFGHFLSKTAQCFRCGNVWKNAVTAAAADMASTPLAYERSSHGHQPLGGGWPSLASMHDDGHATVPKQKPPPAAPPLASVVCGERLGPRRSCRRTLQTKPCPLHPNSPGSTKIKRSRRS